MRDMYEQACLSASQTSMTYRNGREAMLRCKMQARVALVLKIGVLKVCRIVAHNALHEIEVVKQDCTAQTPRYVNPVHKPSACYAYPFSAMYPNIHFEE